MKYVSIYKKKLPAWAAVAIVTKASSDYSVVIGHILLSFMIKIHIPVISVLLFESSPISLFVNINDD